MLITLKKQFQLTKARIADKIRQLEKDIESLYTEASYSASMVSRLKDKYPDKFGDITLGLFHYTDFAVHLYLDTVLWLLETQTGDYSLKAFRAIR